MRKKLTDWKCFVWLKWPFSKRRNKRLNQDIEDFWELLQDEEKPEKPESITYDKNKFYDL